MTHTKNLVVFSTVLTLLLAGSAPGYAGDIKKGLSTGLKAATDKSVTRAVTAKVAAPKTSRVPRTPKGAGVTGVTKVAKTPTSKGSTFAASNIPTRTASGQISAKPQLHQAHTHYVQTGHPLTRFLPTMNLYEKGVDLGKVSEYLFNESLDNVATNPLAWDVRKEIHRLCQNALGFTPEFLYTNSTVNDMLDVLSFEQFILKNEGKFPLAFAQTAAEDGIGEQMTTFLMNHYLLNGGKTMQIADYLWNLYAKAPNARPVEEIIGDVENFVAAQGHLPAIAFFAASEQVAPVIRGAMSMTPEEVALGTEMLLVTQVYDWSWNLPADLSKRVRVIYDKIQEAKISWRGNNTPDRVATAPNR